MEHYRETKDIEEVEEALAEGLRVEAWFSSWWRPIIVFHGVFYINNGAEYLPTMFGRVFRIAVRPEAPKAFAGPTVELTPELLERMRQHCEKQYAQDGCCKGLGCNDCPGGSVNNDTMLCGVSGWSSRINTTERPDPIAKANAEKFLAEHPALTEKRLERVELFRDGVGVLRYHMHGWVRQHAIAVSEKGFHRYVMADGTKSFEPVRKIRKDENEFPVAFERWVEEGE